MTFHMTTNDPNSVSVMYQGNDLWVERGVASASKVEDHWWVDRVFVYPTLRGKGIGRKMVHRVLTEIKKRGGGRVVVCPGGYNMKYSDQRAFYQSCGFATVKPGMMEIQV